MLHINNDDIIGISELEAALLHINNDDIIGISLYGLSCLA